MDTFSYTSEVGINLFDSITNAFKGISNLFDYEITIMNQVAFMVNGMWVITITYILGYYEE